MNRSHRINQLVDRNDKMFNRFAKKVRNGVLTRDDAKQELIAKVIEKINRSPETLTKPINEQDKIAYKVAHNYHIDLIRFYSRRLDTSVYCPGYTDAGLDYGGEELGTQVKEIDAHAPVFHSHETEEPDRPVIEDSYMMELLVRAEQFEERYPGIVDFIKEIVNPSEEVEQKYEEYQNNHKFARQPAGNFIPPYTFVKFVGIPESRLRKYHIVISKILADLGIYRAGEIHARLKK